jgi:hypothetical protein
VAAISGSALPPPAAAPTRGRPACWGDGRDEIAGDQGDDVIDGLDGGIDRVDCGPGEGRVKADAADILSICEPRGC